MSQAGYSEKPLVAKLGYKSGETVLIINAPQWFIGELKNHKVGIVTSMPATWAHGFFTRQFEAEQFLKAADLSKIEKGLWISWPKKSSKVMTDLTEHVLRDVILPLGWVDIKVAAIDEVWSGLKFTRRKNYVI